MRALEDFIDGLREGIEDLRDLAEMFSGVRWVGRLIPLLLVAGLMGFVMAYCIRWLASG